jgi:hypothetical protein
MFAIVILLEIVIFITVSLHWQCTTLIPLSPPTLPPTEIKIEDVDDVQIKVEEPEDMFVPEDHPDFDPNTLYPSILIRNEANVVELHVNIEAIRNPHEPLSTRNIEAMTAFLRAVGFSREDAWEEAHRVSDKTIDQIRRLKEGNWVHMGFRQWLVTEEAIELMKRELREVRRRDWIRG